MISISKAANYLGVSIPTLRRWEKKGYIKAYRTIGNHRRYEISELDNIYNRNKVNINKKRNHDKIKIAAAIYARVSSIDQKQHGDLERQIDTLIKYAEDNNFIKNFFNLKSLHHKFFKLKKIIKSDRDNKK